MNGSSWSRFAQRSGYSGFSLVLFALCPAAFAEISVSNCARAAKYAESRRGSAMLVMQNGQTIFEHYANGGSANRRWPIFSGTKSFWGIAALAALQHGLFRLDDPVSDTITEWKSDPRNLRSQFGNCSAKPTASKARRIFSALRFATETPWRSFYPVWLNLVRLLSTARVIFRFFPKCFAENCEGAASSATSKRTCRTGLDCTISNTKKTLAAIRCLRPALN